VLAKRMESSCSPVPRPANIAPAAGRSQCALSSRSVRIGRARTGPGWGFGQFHGLLPRFPFAGKAETLCSIQALAGVVRRGFCHHSAKAIAHHRFIRSGEGVT